ncbi:MAG: sugar kinase [Streptomycetaceae bacterium]|nr:sugar kinase [Streptomycetaceae bacterium]
MRADTDHEGTPPGSRGLFVGLCVLDIIQAVERLPAPDEKVTALRQSVSAGGPATNAAAAFAGLGGRAALLTGLGRHPLTDGIRADLGRIGSGVRLVDADAAWDGPPPVSSVMVNAHTGERSVVSTNAHGRDLRTPPQLPGEVAAADVVLVDGHHMAIARAAAEHARALGRRVVLDGGSWKPGTAELLRHVDVAVCSAVFRPPGATAPDDVLAFLLDHGVTCAAVSRGPLPIHWRTRGGGSGELPVPAVPHVADTTGAGDILHGALAHALAPYREDRLTEAAFLTALRSAADTASHATATFGTRAWMPGAPPAAAPADPAGRRAPEIPAGTRRRPGAT